MDIPVVTYVIIALIVVLSIIGFGNKRVFAKNLFSVGAILQNKEIYRLFTSQFFHANWAHLFFNMISFYSFGTTLEVRFGPGLMTAIFLSSALCGDLLALVIKRKNPDYTAVGASGAICGIIFSSIFLMPGGSIFILPFPVPLPSWFYAILFMAISLYGIGRGRAIIGHEAPIGGGFSGKRWAVIIKPLI